MSDKITANDFTKLKSRIKAEVNRRKYVGSVTNYGTATYDYNTKAEEGKIIETEYINKIIEPIKAINPTGIIDPVNQGDNITNQLETFDAKITLFEFYFV